MGYLRLYDYNIKIQTLLFNQLLQLDDTKRVRTEYESMSKMRSYLIQKYDLDSEFQDTVIFNPATKYQANALVELNYTAWVKGDYVIGNYVSYSNGNVYVCILGTTAQQVPTDPIYWTLVGVQNGLYYIKYPYPVFNVYAGYVVGDRVFWKGKIYQCLIPTVIPDHFAELQSVTYANVPLNNIFPDDPVNGKINWGAGVDYTIQAFLPNSALPVQWTAGTYAQGTQKLYNGLVWQALVNTSAVPGSDITSWQSQTWITGDNRNAQLVACMMWITIYELSPLISPRNIPVLWQQKYDEMMNWLQMSAEGKVTLEAPEKQPSKGARIRYGGTIKQQNGY